MRGLTLGLAFSLLVTAGFADEPPRPLAPVDPARFVVEPDRETTLSWRFISEPTEGPIPFVIRNYSGQPTGQSAAIAGADGIVVEANVSLAAGFHEIDFESLGQRFGVIALPAPPEGSEPDPYFAIDGAMTWLVRDPETRQALIEMAGRCGIAQIRERLRSGSIQPEATRWSWDAQGADSLRADYHERAMPVLEMAHDAPAWMGRVGPYPDDLVAFSQHWETIARRWQDSWGGIELWNEPDIFFGGDLPADQYAAMVKSLIHGLRRADLQVPIIGGALSHDTPAFLQSLTANGVLEPIDAFSFHTYARATEMEPIVTRYREWLRSSGHPNLPLWLTECGRPWPKGTDRPNTHDDAVSAQDIARKAVEARACGVARYFAFVLPFYEENTNNFGMVGHEATPLRSLAGYAQTSRALSHRDYLGDLQVDNVPEGLPAIRVFGRSDETTVVAVIASPRGAQAEPVAVSLGLPVPTLIGIDGRSLEAPGDAPVIVADGLVYAFLPRETASPRIETTTPVRALHAEKSSVSTVAVGSGLVLRFNIDPQRMVAVNTGYKVRKNQPDGRLPLTVTAFNLTDQPMTANLRATLSGEKLLDNAERRLTLEPQSRSSGSWSLPLEHLFDTNDAVSLTVEAHSPSGEFLDRLVITLLGEPELSAILARFEQTDQLPIDDLARWSKAAAGSTDLDLTALPGGGWKMDVHHPPGIDRWAYPVFQLPEGLDLSQHFGLAIRLRIQNKGAARVFLWEGDTNVGYLNPAPLAPADGEWHSVVLRFADLTPSLANAPDANQRLDLDQVRRISIGINSETDENTLEVSDVHIVGNRP